MKKLLLTLCSVGILSTWGYAQQAPKIVCGQDLLSQKLSANAPEFKRAIERTFDQLKATPVDASRDPMVYEIPVVVHIVWKDPEENLPDSVIQNQIDVLNADIPTPMQVICVRYLTTVWAIRVFVSDFTKWFVSKQRLILNPMFWAAVAMWCQP